MKRGTKMTTAEKINTYIDFIEIKNRNREEPTEYKAEVKPYAVVCEFCGEVKDNSLCHLYKRNINNNKWQVKCQDCKKTMPLKKAKKLKKQIEGLNRVVVPL